MNSDLKQFLAKYLSVVFATLMSVAVFTFMAIPYSLGGHPGEDSVVDSMLQAPAKTSNVSMQVNQEQA
jgi:hypothetical protein